MLFRIGKKTLILPSPGFEQDYTASERIYFNADLFKTSKFFNKKHQNHDLTTRSVDLPTSITQQFISFVTSIYFKLKTQ
ncbi:MAG: hypothetical protein K0R59_633 [Sphingobacterium sp.]|jgi:hypothetical protein|nr:hypothetical protein [Sphingobacterium sp.]